MIETRDERAPSALLVTVLEEKTTDWQISRLEEEAASLLSTLGIEVAGSLSFNLRSIDAATYIGSGQVGEVKAHALFFECDLVYFDTSLSPRNARNLEALLECPVMDRNELIIEIFASRARTREARLQVMLARNQFLLPRLRKSNVVYSQQRGGVRGAKGEGERQIELDRRRLESEITRLKKEIALVKSQRDTQRKKRLSSTSASFALVGYTNSGKSSLLNALCASDALAEDKLFATLDPLERTLRLDSGLSVVLCDTVGFVSRLPHFLIDAFSSTLEEAKLADALLLVLDASSPDVEENYRTTLSVLEDLGALDKPMTVILNKCDRPHADDFAIASIISRHPGALKISAKEGSGLEELKERIAQSAISIIKARTISIPLSDTKAIEEVYRKGGIISADYREDEVIFTLQRQETKPTKDKPFPKPTL